MSTRFHKAAQDGMLEILREATKRDCNAKDEDGMTPTLWAAFEGNLDALRLLVGRGGDPEKCNYHFGQSALHLSAAKGHLACVTFLVAFGVNVWQLDHDSRTPMQLAAAHSRHAVLEYLDKAAAKQEATNKKEAKLRKEKALKDAERHRKKYEERMKKEREKEEKRIKKVEKEILGGHKIEVDTPIPTTLPSRKSVIEVTGPTFTQIVGAGTLSKKPAVQTGVKKIIDRKLRATNQLKHSSNDIRVDPEPNKIIHTGQRKDSQIIYVNSYDAQNNGGKRGRIADVFDTKGELIRSISQPDYLNSAGVGMGTGVGVGVASPLQEQASIFDRPGFGSVAFRQRNALAGTLSALPALDLDKDSGGEGGQDDRVGGGGGGVVGGGEEDSSIGSAGSLAKRNQVGGTLALHWPHHADIDTSDDEQQQQQDGDPSAADWQVALKRFLTAGGCGEWWAALVEQRIDLDALLMLSDGDLVQLGMPMGPRRKLMHQCSQRRAALQAPGHIADSRL
ncbi:hypothetical protein LSTR_LSTR013070 [Laodelphax striatellus]|uniref:Uncharacterized protein n=1 Tax=Laodelphax striatellus TaxID=195883 RepID=A0A482WPY5_LAOST|nr:hypothetical protein LSTR_LSTR013070 [Laodelphax striatellus]